MMLEMKTVTPAIDIAGINYGKSLSKSTSLPILQGAMIEVYETVVNINPAQTKARFRKNELTLGFSQTYLKKFVL